ncbi:MAG: sulfotransferase [Fuerstiella sp.]|nr:sulfotransferase [Fuerstiella sp.]
MNISSQNSPDVAQDSGTPTVEAASARAETQPKKQGHFCIFHGLTFGNWVRLLASRPPMHWSRLPRLASITAFSVVNSLEKLLENCVYGRRISRQKIEHPPIFIIGHWRSGTTLLHNLMSLDPQFTYPNLYQVIFPGSFLLTERIATKLTAWGVPKTRPVDDLPAGWDMTQEDEVALLAMTLLSPYLMLAHQRDPSTYGRFFDLTELTPKERRRWQDAFVYFLKKLTIRANKPIVLKSPPHTYRIPILLEMFPDAKFIHIHRDPYVVYKSSIHLRKTLFTENGLGKPCLDDMEENMMQLYSSLFEAYENTKHLIPAGHLHEVRFEDLEADPLGQMCQVYEKLGLPGWQSVEPKIQAEVPALAAYKKNTYNIDEPLKRKIYARWHAAFERYGYPSRLPESADIET